MVKVTEVAYLFLEVCPTVQPEWEKHLKDWEGETLSHYVEISIFVNHLVKCHEKSQTESFTRVFELVERLIIEGNDDTQSLMIAGLLEGLQNTALNKGFGYQVFEPYLKPKTLVAWQELIMFWEEKKV